MKYASILKYVYVVLFVAVLCSGAALVHAQSGLNCNKGTCYYTPLEPLPTGDTGAQDGTNFPKFVSGLFRVLITLGGLFAVVMLVVAGIGYMISESGVDIEKAKDRAKAALWGLLLLTMSWLILYTINPQLLNFKLLATQGATAQPTPNSVVPPAPNAVTPALGSPEAVQKIMDDQAAARTAQLSQADCAAVTNWLNSNGVTGPVGNRGGTSNMVRDLTAQRAPANRLSTDQRDQITAQLVAANQEVALNVSKEARCGELYPQ